MKSVVVINGSPKKLSDSAELASRYCQSLAASTAVDVTTHKLVDMDVRPCTGCRTCTRTGPCPHDDAMGTIRQSLSGADLVVLSSPVHFNHVSSVFHNFIERSLVDLHVFPYVGTPFVSLVSTNGSGEQDADKFLTKMGLLFGMIKLGKAFNSNNDPFKQDAFDALVKKSAGALEHAQGVKPSLMNRLYVRSMRKIIKENPEFFPYESGVWAERGWFSMSYAELRSARAAASAPAAA